MQQANSYSLPADSITIVPKYLPHIDGLRAIAVLAVLAFHAAPSVVLR